MKVATQKPASLAAWLARAGDDEDALRTAAAALAQPEAETKIAGIAAEALTTLQLLESLDLDRETQAA